MLYTVHKIPVPIPQSSRRTVGILQRWLFFLFCGVFFLYRFAGVVPAIIMRRLEGLDEQVRTFCVVAAVDVPPYRIPCV